MPGSKHNKILAEYLGYDIYQINSSTHGSQYFCVMVDGQLSTLALATIKAAKNVIDTHIKNLKR